MDEAFLGYTYGSLEGPSYGVDYSIELRSDPLLVSLPTSSASNTYRRFKYKNFTPIETSNFYHPDISNIQMRTF
jgi:hypothetical protein